jgi:hypothetical protein
MPTVITGTDGVSQVQAGSIQSDDLAAGVGGKVLQVVQGVLDQNFETTSASFVDVSGLSVSITPSSSSNKILVFWSVGNVGADGYGWVALFRDSTQIATTSENADPVSAGGFGGGSSTGESYYGVRTENGSFLDTPSTTNSITYKIKAITKNQAALYINSPVNFVSGSGSDNNTANISTITAMEIAV